MKRIRKSSITLRRTTVRILNGSVLRLAGGGEEAVPTKTVLTWTDIPECSSSITHADSCKCQ